MSVLQNFSEAPTGASREAAGRGHRQDGAHPRPHGADVDVLHHRLGPVAQDSPPLPVPTGRQRREAGTRL